MNRCEEVLKHSINKGFKIEKDELYHSDTYLGSEYDEGLKHWKYIKKYKNSKGKTVYVYANKETHNKIKNFDNRLANLTESLLKESYQSKYALDREKGMHYRKKQEYKQQLKARNEQFDSGLAKRDIRNIMAQMVRKANKKVKSIKREAVITGIKFISGILGGV